MSRRLEDWSRAQAERRPEKTAVVHRAERISYSGLERLSNRIARAVGEAGCRPGDRVALMCPKSIPAPAAMLGVLKAGCVYVPVAPESPAARTARILNQCECPLALASPAAERMLAEAAAEGMLERVPAVGRLSAGTELPAGLSTAFSFDDLDSFSCEPPAISSPRSEAAHILFTSGSTGTPKGVVITHANVVACIAWTLEFFGLNAEDRISQHPPLTFDLSTMDIYSAFAAGAELHLVPPELNLLPHKLAAFIRDSRLTQWFSVPSALQHMTNHAAVRPNDFPFLKRLLWCGEKFAVPALIEWMKLLPHVEFTNLYGPTEATIASSFYRVESPPRDENVEIPIGSPCAGEGLHVLDAKLNPLPPGEIGDLYISGVGLSPGYWKDAGKTAGAFLPSPFDDDPRARIYSTGDLARLGEDGLVYLIGRKDTQIKSRGHRIELGEIEAALAAVEAISESAVVAIEVGGLEGKAICCAYSPREAENLTPQEIKKRLTKSLPGYMIPSRWKSYERLPLNGSGKIDRRRLREEFAASFTASAARVEVEREAALRPAV